MTKPTEKAVIAAAILKWFNGRFGTEIGFFTEEDQEQLNAIIDDETGLPELKARIDYLEAESDGLSKAAIHKIESLKAEKAELLEACKAALPILEDAYGGQQPPPRYEINLVKAAIAKATSSPK